MQTRNQREGKGRKPRRGNSQGVMGIENRLDTKKKKEQTGTKGREQARDREPTVRDRQDPRDREQGGAKGWEQTGNQRVGNRQEP